MSHPKEPPSLTDSLEDYLETVYTLVREKKFARVKDIALARNVRPGSVSPAMKKLAELGLIEYVRREYICLTRAGEERARRVVARHQLLCRLFEDILRMPGDAAEKEACAMEHSLSDEGMDRLVRFFEFLRLCPDAKDLLEKFHDCQAIFDDAGVCAESCMIVSKKRSQRRNRIGTKPLHIDDLRPGEMGRVTQIGGRGKTRQRLLDMGLMPDVVVSVTRLDSVKNKVWIGLGGFEISLSASEAAAIVVAKVG